MDAVSNHSGEATGLRNDDLIDPKVLVDSALRVLDDSPAPPVRVRLLRDVLGRGADDAELDAAIRALDESLHVQVLLQEQRSDGSWGRFHSQDSTAKQKIITTEAGVHRAVELGLPRYHQVFQRVQPYLEAILEGRARIPDRAEKHENWPTGVAMFAGALLSRFAPEAPTLDRTWEFWSQVVRRSFAEGQHDIDAELGAHQQLLGRSGKPGWMRLNSKPVVMILGSRAADLALPVEAGYVRWLWEDCPDGLVYADTAIDQDPQRLKGWRLNAWLTILELFSEFPSSKARAGPAIARLLTARNRDRLWDFGIQSSCPRLSDSYRRKGVTAHDWTTRVTCLLNRYLA